MKKELITIDDAATILGVSKQTIRRRIKSGELVAQKEIGPYGEQWMIPSNQIQQAQALIDVVAVSRQVTVNDLVATITAKLASENAQIRSELAEIKRNQQRIEESINNRDKLLMEAMREIQCKNKPWYKRIFD